MIAYTQLYLGKDNITNSVQPWERYLPEYKNTTDEIKATITPSQAQRGFADLLKVRGRLQGHQLLEAKLLVDKSAQLK